MQLAILVFRDSLNEKNLYLKTQNGYLCKILTYLYISELISKYLISKYFVILPAHRRRKFRCDLPNTA